VSHPSRLFQPAHVPKLEKLSTAPSCSPPPAAHNCITVSAWIYCRARCSISRSKFSVRRYADCLIPQHSDMMCANTTGVELIQSTQRWGTTHLLQAPEDGQADVLAPSVWVRGRSHAAASCKIFPSASCSFSCCNHWAEETSQGTLAMSPA